MDVVILCGGRGTRLSEKTDTIPKPLVEVGEMPIIWHIMKYFSGFDFKRFILTLGYKGDLIKHWFLNTYRVTGSFELNLQNPVLPPFPDDWNLVFLNTGLESGTAYRLKQTKTHLSGKRFMLAYGDCLADVDINSLLQYHEQMNRKKNVLVTMSIHKPRSKYGIIREDSGLANSFIEKPRSDDWVGIGYMVCETSIFDQYFPESPEAMFEANYLQQLTERGQLAVFKHEGFFAPMDTYKDYVELNNIWNQGHAKWKVW